MADVTAIRHALADKLAEVFSVAVAGEGDAWSVSPTIVTQPDVPQLVVMKGPTEYGEAMGYSLHKLTMLVVAYVSAGSSEESQDLLDELLAPSGDRSVYATIMAPDHDSQVTLGGVCGDLIVTRDSGHRLYHVAGIDYLGADWEIDVYA